MHDGFLSLADIIKKDPAFEKIRTVIKFSDVVSEFHKIFPDLKKIASAVKAEKGILFLRVENPAWRSELNFKQKILKDKINTFFNDEIITRIKFISK